MPRKKKTFLEMTNDEFMRINKTEVVTYTMASMVWYKNRLVNAKINESEILRGEVGKRRSKCSIGKMFFFRYYAKYHEDLPYYDQFPLTLFFHEDSKHLWGINLHYLSPEVRLVVFKRLMDIIGAKYIDDRQKINVTWQTLKDMAQSKWIKHAVKCYLKDNFKSYPQEVQPEEWIGAIFLPVERFIRQTKQAVWRDIK